MNEGVKVYVFDRGRTNYYMGYKDPVTGSKVTRSTGTRNKKEAIKVAAKWEAEVQEGRYKTASRITWEEFRQKYEEEHVSGLADTTFEKVSAVFNTIEEVLNPDRLVKLNAEQISRYQKKLRRLGRKESTIKSHLRHLKSALNWAESMGYLIEVPKIKMPPRAKRSKLMKGRPITGEEFDRMLSKIKHMFFTKQEIKKLGKEADKDPRVESWKHLLYGIWWSGLRLDEAMQLTWNDREKISFELTGKRPLMIIPASAEKGNQDRVLPIAPEFAEMIHQVPEEERTGYFFNPISKRKNYWKRLESSWVGRLISEIGENAGVKVSPEKFASAHDLRRSFGERWSTRVPAQVLMQMMRHESIETTLKYYVGRNAETMSDAIYNAMPGNDLGATLGATSEIHKKKTHNESS